jgi:hypothetical protein
LGIYLFVVCYCTFSLFSVVHSDGIY